MSIRIRRNSVYQTVMSGIQFWGVMPPDNSGNAYSGSYMTYCFDPMYALFRNHRWCYPNGVQDLGSLMNLRDCDLYDDTLSVRHKPIPFNSLGVYDDQTYGSLYRNLVLFESVFSGRSVIAPSTQHEHPTRHSTFTGELVIQQEELPQKRIGNSFLDRNFELRDWLGDYQVSGVTSDTWPLHITPYLSHSDWVMYDFRELLVALKSNDELTYATHPSGVFRDGHLTDLDFAEDETYLIVTYHVHAHEYNEYYHLTRYADWDAHLVIHRGYEPGVIAPSTGLEVSTVRCTAPLEIKMQNVGGDFPIDRTTITGSTDQNGVYCLWPRAIVLSTPSDTCAGSCEVAFAGRAFTMLSSDRFLEIFRRDVDKAWSDITPSALFSTVDAFKQAEGSLNMNVLQNLAKLPDIVDALPQFEAALKILGKLARRDISLLTLKQILDLATSTVLQSNFEWRPYVDIVTSYLPTLVSTLRSLGDIQENAIGRGSFRFELENQLGRKNVTLQTRTKLVMDASASALLSAALGFDAIGLLPKPSNIWDLIPFSFVANWFTGVGQAMRRAEYSLFIATIPAYYVHTYTLTSPLSDDELDLLGASNSTPEPSCLRLYYRDVSLLCPAPRDSRFGFGIPRDLPPIGLLGSLLYQLILG